jgi:IS30 family transposase
MVVKKIIGVVGPKNMPIGEDHHNAKLSDAEVEKIRQMHDEGKGYRRIARETGVHRSTVRDICTMKRRACTPDGYKTILKTMTAVKAPKDKDDFSDLA